MPLEIPLLPLALLGLVFAASLIISLRPPEGYRLWLAVLLRSKSQAGRAPQFYNPFGEQPQKFTPTSFRTKVPGAGRGWIRIQK
jgi:hypothetical protein